MQERREKGTDARQLQDAMLTGGSLIGVGGLRPARAIAVLCAIGTIAVLDAPANAQLLNVRSATSILVPRAHWTSLSRLGPENQGWISVADDSLWILDLVAKRLVVVQVADGSVRTTTRRSSTTTSTAVRHIAPAGRVIAEFPLPSIDQPVGGWAQLSVAAVNSRQAWLVDSGRQQLWFFQDGAFDGPWPAGEAVGGAAVAHRNGELIVNTPANQAAAFATFGSASRSLVVRRRFGSRLRDVPGLDDAQRNTWRLTSLADGSMVAAHAYAPLARRYDVTGEMVWERELRSGTGDSLRQRQATLPGEPQQDRRTIVFATNIVGLRGGFGVRYGLEPVIERFDEHGTGTGTLRLAVRLRPGETRWTSAGMASFGDAVLTAERNGVVWYGSEQVTPRLRAGRVVDAKGTRIVSARVEIGIAEAVVWRGVTDDRGEFVPTSVPSDVMAHIKIDADDFARLERRDIVEKMFARPFVMSPGTSVCVRALDSRSGQVVTSFQVTLIRRQVGSTRALWETGPRRQIESADGVGCVTAPWPSPWLVRVEAEPFAPGEVVLSEAKPGPHDIELVTGGAIRVFVLDPQRQPVSAATVALVDEAGTTGGSFVVAAEHVRQTGDDGSVHWTALAPRNYDVRVSHERFPLARREVTVDPAGIANVEFVLDGGSVVVPRVASANGVVEGARVTLVPRGFATQHVLACTTGPDGRCSIESVQSGSFDAITSAIGFVGARQRLAVSPGAAGIQVDISLRTGVRITGHIENMEMYGGVQFDVSATAPGVGVQSSPALPDGRFAIEGAPTGRVSMWIRRSGSGAAYLFEEVWIEASEPPPVILRLPIPSKLHGSIRSSGAACIACPVVATRMGGDAASPSVNTESDVNGTYELILPYNRGTYGVRVIDRINSRSVVEVFEVSGDTRRDFSLGEHSMRGRAVVETTGAAAGGARIHVTAESGLQVAETVTDASGMFSMEGLPPGTHTVSAVQRNLAGTATVTLFGEPSPHETLIVLRDNGGIRLRVVAADTRTPVGFAAASVQSADGRFSIFPSLLVSAGGETVIPAPPGVAPYTIVVKSGGYAFRTMHGLTTTAVWDVALVPSGRSFSVAVLGSTRPCAFELRDTTTKRPVGLSVILPVGPVPFTLDKALFNEIEPGSYDAILHTCDNRRETVPVVLAAGSVPALTFGK